MFVTANFPPLVGGMERLIYHAYQTVASKFEVSLVGPDGCERFSVASTPTVAVSRTPIARFLLGIQWHALRLARRTRPDIILSGSGLTAPAGLYAARKTGAKLASFVHGLDLVVNSRLYQRLFLPSLLRADLLIANSRNTARLTEQAGASPDRIALLHPGVSIPSSCSPSGDALRREIGAESRSILLSVGRLSARKGVAEFILHALPRIAASRPDVLFLVLGGEPTNALKRSGGEIARIQAAVDAAGMADHVLMMGQVGDDTLRAAYDAADLFVFPILEMEGDVEGFGMVALEAAAHGLPTVAFAVGGVPDAVRDQVSGYLVTPGDYPEFARVVSEHLAAEQRDAWRARCKAHAEQFEWRRYGERLEQLLHHVLAP